MMKQILIAFFGILTLSLSSQSLWTKSDISNFRSADEEDKMILPKAYDSYTLSVDEIAQEFAASPDEDAMRKGLDGKLISLPMPGGEFEDFQFYYSPVMQSGLAAKFPSIRSYKGVSTTNKSKNVRLSVGPYGVHAAIHGTDGVVYIDPYARGNRDEYIVYDVKDYMSQLSYDVPLCGTEDSFKDTHFEDVMQTRNNAATVPLRVYRLAIACTGEWGAVRGTPENAIADMVIGVDRMNQIYENETAMRFILIDDNDLLLNFDGETDPYENSNGSSSGSAMLQINTNIVNSRVGIDSYDIGHVYARSCDTGGIARLGSMCDNFNKAAAVTCHYSNNLDFMASRVTAHEIGHQMSAQHTFNNCDGENESLGNGFEPGSGSTIMSYGGICGPDRNIFNGSDDYYHVGSLMQIFNHTRDGGNADECAEKIETSNEEPIITMDYEGLFSIPEGTYFFLEGSATDANDDDMTYSWEAFNAGPLSPLGSPIGTAPRFRSFPPSPSPRRYFPSPDNILNGQFDRTEVLPVGNMDLRFVFTVRDNNAEAGTSVYEEIRFTTIASTEKFEVTSQNSGVISHEVGDEIEVTWTVGNTTGEAINAQFVDILMHTGSTAEFDIQNMEVLAQRIPNNGSATVYIPNVPTNRGRVIVRASDKIFFDINQRNVQIVEPVSPSVFFTPSQSAFPVCLPSDPTVEIVTSSFAGLEGDVTLSVIDGLPLGAVATFSSETVAIGEASDLTVTFPNGTISQQYDIRVQAIVADQDTFARNITMYVTDTDHSAMQAVSPSNGQSSVTVAPTFEWTASPNAIIYSLEVATEPTFGSSIVMSEEGLSDLDFVSSTILEKGIVYYWRIVPSNSCGEGSPSPVSAFSTEVLACTIFEPDSDDLPINISSSGLPTIESELDVLGGSIADVNVLSLVGEHDNNKDLFTFLVSPMGTEVQLFGNICNQKDFNCSFDQASNSAVKCPLNNGSTYRPKESLDAFNGENAEGTWTLRIEDRDSGDGGRLEGYSLEICASVVVQSPFIVRNNRVTLPWGGTPTIGSGNLKVEDNDNTSDELIYTIVELPSKGSLNFEGDAVNIGDQFTQQNIDQGKLSYEAGLENYETIFSFTVIDGQGGFLGITNFEIEVDQLNSTFDEAIAQEISVYPVPANNILTIDLSSTDEEFTSLDVVNLQGQRLISQNIVNQKSIALDVSRLASGIYFVNLKNDEYTIPKKIIVE